MKLLNLQIYENLRGNLKYLRDNFGTKIKREEEEDFILRDYTDFITNNEIFLVDLYSQLGDFLKQNCSGWTLWLLSGNPKLTRFLKMKASLKIPINNGGIDCRWMKYLIN